MQGTSGLHFRPSAVIPVYQRSAMCLRFWNLFYLQTILISNQDRIDKVIALLFKSMTHKSMVSKKF